MRIIACIMLVVLTTITGCASVSGDDSALNGPSVLGKFKGENTEKWIPFTDDGKGTSSVVATQGYVDGKIISPFTGGAVTSPIDLYTGKTGNKLSLSMYNSGSGHSNAPTTLDSSAEYLTLGYREYAKGSYRMIAFGYKGSITLPSPAAMGFQETQSDVNTTGDLIFATRAKTDASSPLVRMRITSDGHVRAEDASYAPTDAKDFTTKAYVDKAVAAAYQSGYTAGVAYGLASCKKECGNQ